MTHVPFRRVMSLLHHGLPPETSPFVSWSFLALSGAKHKDFFASRRSVLSLARAGEALEHVNVIYVSR